MWDTYTFGAFRGFVAISSCLFILFFVHLFLESLFHGRYDHVTLFLLPGCLSENINESMTATGISSSKRCVLLWHIVLPTNLAGTGSLSGVKLERYSSLDIAVKLFHFSSSKKCTQVHAQGHSHFFSSICFSRRYSNRCRHRWIPHLYVAFMVSHYIATPECLWVITCTPGQSKKKRFSVTGNVTWCSVGMW